MSMRNFEWRRAFAAGTIAVCGICGLAAAAPEGDDGAARLRAAFRSATVQLRDLQDQNAMLTAKQSEAERDRMALTQQLAAAEKERDALRQQLKAGQDALQTAARQSAAQLEAQKQGLASMEAAYRDNLAKWQTSYNEAAAAARMRDDDAKKLDELLVQTRTRATACEAKNTELYKFGKDLIDVYGRQDVFGALGAKEPFTKLKRVEIENLMQDYEDKLRANMIARPAG
jgi:septal ring factor EnvC (AmiA/AmiB activator)